MEGRPRVLESKSEFESALERSCPDEVRKALRAAWEQKECIYRRDRAALVGILKLAAARSLRHLAFAEQAHKDLQSVR